jgi:hypothetical protein
MNPQFACPVCAEHYEDEDFCPKHGARLVPCPSADASEASSASKADGHDDLPTPDHPSATDAPEETAPTPGGDGESRILKFMNRFKLRPVGAKTGAEGVAGKSGNSPSDFESPLPKELTDQGWKLAGSLCSSAGVDCWRTRQLSDQDPREGLFQRYRTGALTTDTTYRKLETLDCRCLAKVRAHGTVDCGGARADYDLVEIPVFDSDLNKWLADTPASEGRALHVLPLVTNVLRQLLAAGVRPIVIEPAQLAILADGSYCLTSVGALADDSAAVQFRPEFARSALLPHSWAGPELLQQGMLTENAAVFSLGQILAHALWGQPCSYEELQTGAVPFHAVGDAKLARVLMGCLWPRTLRRWTCEELFRAVDTDALEALPSAGPWASLAPGASSQSISFAGDSFWRLEDLLERATTPPNWHEATHNIEAILDWAKGTAWAGQAKLLREALDQRRSSDWVLVALARAVRPHAPISWRELDLSDAGAARSLVSVAQNALQGCATSMRTVQDLFDADLRGAFEQHSNRPLG